MKIEELTLEQKIGQLIVAGFSENYVTDDLKELIEQYHIGNIILFQKNIIDSIQLGKLNRNIQEVMEKYNANPAFICMDQEGGMVTRLFNKATCFPGNMAVAAGASYEETYALGAAIGQELRHIGINMNLAPVMDINNNQLNPVIGVRSYGDVPERVAEYGKNFFKGLQSEGVVSFAKHFPGHGNTNVDSHLGLPTILSDLYNLNKVELIPFIEAINNGIDGIMSAHIIFSALEKNNLPATLSKAILTGLLRERLGFNGLIITDCMEMKAIINNYGIEEASVMAINAGADLVCISHTRELQVKAVNAIKEAVENGTIKVEDLNSKVERILEFKQKYDLYNWRKLSGQIPAEELEEHGRLAAEISEKSVTVISNYKGLIPINNEGLITISPISQVTSIADENVEETNFGKILQERIGGEYVNYKPNNIDEDYILSKVENKSVIIFGCYNMSLDNTQKRLLDKLLAERKEIILVALRNPYDITEYRDRISTILCTYEYTKLSINSLIKILKGENVAKGRLPVEC